MSYDLTQLGWKSFQDLACAILAEVLKRPVQTFLGSNDAGRDGAFLGTWIGEGGATGKSTIQCKFISKPGATLGLAALHDELPKAAKLAAQGLAEDYVIVTNAGVSGEADSQICQAFEGAGVKTCRVLGSSWIIQQLTENAKLRMLVPRVYGIGDLSHIITGHGYKQAKAILDSMGSDLSCFVPTEAYRQALRALHEHGFVILLGDPASGKSTIAAILALGALDEGCLGALKINAPDQISLWHPGEKQFLWVDDAFGPNQFDAARMSRWNAELGALRAAVEGGARIVFTSRNYIWEAARPHLKTSAFPPLRESQVVVNVHALTDDERAQMLYNHVRRAQPQKIRKRLKPLLAGVAANEAFIPETARRLGDPLFTAKLVFTEERFTRLVEHPVEFLTEVLEQLDDASRAAVALIFLNSQSGVPSPITASPALDMVTRLMGVQPADVARALQHLNDSLTRLTHQEDGPRWVFRHPTVTDAFAGIVAKSPELVELYVHGAKLDRLIQEAECQKAKTDRDLLRIPAQLYPALVERLKIYPLDEGLKSFLGARCEKAFLEKILKVRTDILDWAAKVSANGLSLSGKLLLAALTSFGLMPEDNRLRLVDQLGKYSITWLDAKALEDKVWQQIFTPAEFDEYAQRFREKWLAHPENTFDQLGSFSSDDEIGMYTDFKENIKVAQRHFEIEEDDEAFSELYAQIDAHIEELEAAAPSQVNSGWSAPSADNSAESTATANSIFFDVDD
ncbi:nSTAND3 domain-containing NTPase [Bradyrhizobium ottawaense]|uniref:nSTAND3 domain-containing NTPase n=1 Tax=Bradyrhizobium ottawaense TaxID=931866 RepID=UPI003850C826